MSLSKVGIVIKTDKVGVATPSEVGKAVSDGKQQASGQMKKVEIVNVQLPAEVRAGEVFSVTVTVRLNAIRPFTWGVVVLTKQSGEIVPHVVFFTPLRRECETTFQLVESEAGRYEYTVRAGFNPFILHDEEVVVVEVR